MTHQCSDSRIAVACIGARQRYAAPLTLAQDGTLQHLYTDAYVKSPLLQRALNLLPAAGRRLASRHHPHIPPSKVTALWEFALWYEKGRRSTGSLYAFYAEASERFNQAVITAMGEPTAAGLYGYDANSLELFGWFATGSAVCVLEQTTPPWRHRLDVAHHCYDKWPDWEAPFAVDLAGMEQLATRNDAELSMADVVLVPSLHVRDMVHRHYGLLGNLATVPYPVDLDHFRPPDVRQDTSGRPLRALYIGQLSVQKGIPTLVEALKLLAPRVVQCVCVGESRLLPVAEERVRRVAQLRRPVDRSGVLGYLHWADVVVIPSLSEGAPLVTAEALATGTPVIASEPAAAYVREGTDGFVVPPTSPDAFAAALLRYAEDRELLEAHADAALEDRERLGIRTYSMRLVHALHAAGAT